MSLTTSSNQAAASAEPGEGDDGPLDVHSLAAVRSHLRQASAQELLGWALERWGRRVAICTAFQAEGSVLLDMAWRLDPGVRVVTLDTGRLPQETHDLIERVRWRYGIRVEVHTPDARAVEAMVSSDGPNLFYHSLEGRKTCCRIRKVEPLKRALEGLAAWITGLRRDQAPSRAGVRRLEIDPGHGGITKLNPLAGWRVDQVGSYLEEHDVPYHALYDQGFASIGCAPCTRAVAPGDDPRSGRWWWEPTESPKECGLHATRIDEPLVQVVRS